VTTAPAHPEQQEGGTMPTNVTWSRGEKWLLRAGIASGAGVGTLGLASSYRALEKKAAAPVAAGGWNWGGQAWMLPVGVDLGILTFSVVNLLLVKAEQPLSWVKWVPRILTIVTIVLNWQTGATLEGKLGHAALAALWVVLSEIAAHLYAAHIGRLKGRRQMERIRLARWIHHPISSARINRLMKTWEIPSYADALERDRQRMVYRSTLRQKYGRLWRFKAPEEKLQPLRLLGYGMTLEEALSEPDRQETSKELREQQRDLQRAKNRLQKIEAESKVRTAELQAEAAQVRAAGDLKAAKAEADAAASVAVQQAEADLQVRRAEAEAEIKRLAAEAQARVKELEDAEAAREAERARQQEKDQLKWEAERARIQQQQALETRATAVEARREQIEAEARAAAETAEAERREAEARAAAQKAQQEAAEALRKKREADLKAEEARLKKAEAEARAKALEKQAADDAAAAEAARLKAAQDQLKAAEAEAEARLTPVEREARKVADMIRAEGLEAVTLARIEQTFGVSAATASGRRKRALQYLQETGELPAQRLNGHDLTHA
jgi:myosin heavy subunit